jgi:hypothetical protein
MEPLTWSFGTTGSGIVSFAVVADNPRGQIAGWSGGPKIIVTPIAGSDPPITQLEKIYTGPSRVMWRLYLDSIEDYQALKAKEGTIDILTVAANTQTHPGDAVTVNGEPHVQLPHTQLLLLNDEDVRFADYVEVEATFVRQLDPATGLPVAFT